MKPIKVLHVLSVEKPAFYFTNLVDHSDRGRVEHSFANFAPPSEFSETIARRGLRMYDIDRLAKPTLPLSALRLHRVVQREDPDVVHTHLFEPSCIGLLIATLNKKKRVLTRHHSDAIHRLKNRANRTLYLRMEKANNRQADHIIAPSKMVRECIVEWEGTSSEKVSVIPYPQTSERFDEISPERVERTRTELGMDRQLSLVCVSRLFDRKGHIYLFKALARIVAEGYNLKLYLVGTGHHQSTLERQSQELKIAPYVEFLGWRSDVLEIIGGADIVVHPSLEDALSQSLIESLMLARPIVATDISGASDTLDDGKYGSLVPPEDAESLFGAIRSMIDDLQAAQERARPGRSYLLDYMNAERVTEEYTKIYQRLVHDQ